MTIKIYRYGNYLCFKKYFSLKPTLSIVENEHTDLNKKCVISY